MKDLTGLQVGRHNVLPQDLLSPLGMGSEKKERMDRKQHVYCYRAEEKSEVLVFEELKEI